MKNAYMKQAEFVSGLAFEQLSEAAVHSAKRMLIDAIGGMAAGARLWEPPAQAAFTEPPAGSHTIVGGSKEASREWAALVNGCNMVATEMDEGNQFAKGHPLSHVLPALLAEAQGRRYTGRQFLTALVAGYEVAARWGAAVTLGPAVHPHGNWGTAGAGAAVAKLRGCSPALVKEIILLSNSMAMPSAWASAFRGANVRNGYIGASNMLGLLASDMAGLGMRSHEEVVASVFRDMLGTKLEEELLTEDLGEQFWIEKNYMKIHACCRFIHGAVDAVLKLLDDGLPPEQIDYVNVETYKAASALTEVRPDNAFAAKFSIPFSIAILLCRGAIGQEQFTPETMTDPLIADMAARIQVREDPALTALLPDVRATRVTIGTKDGRERTCKINYAVGDPMNPLSDTQITDKFHSLSQLVWEKHRREQIIETVRQLEHADDLDELFPLLSI